MEDYLQPAHAFLDWFRAWPGTTFHDDIAIVDLRAKGAGRGIVAQRDIPADATLFTIPRSAVLSAATSELAARIPSIMQGQEEEEKDGGDNEKDDSDNDDDARQDPWTSLILILIYESLRGPQSPWKPYLDVLPSLFDTPMFWSDDALRELQASPVVGRVGRQEADQMIQTKVLPVIRAHADVFFSEAHPLDDDALVQLAHRMGSTIMAYSFSLEKEDDDDDEDEEKKSGGDGDVDMKDGDEEEHGHEHEHDSDTSSSSDGWVEDKDDQLPLGMVPMADMLNADAECNAHIHHGIDALTATALRPIRAGEEILNYYGPLSNGELLRRYGYTTDKHAFFDAVDIPWPLVQEHLAQQLRLAPADAAQATEAAEAAAGDDDDWDDPIMLDREFDQDEDTGVLRVPDHGAVLTQLPPTLRRQARAFARAARKQQAKRQDKARGKAGKIEKKEKSEETEKEAVAAAIADTLAARLAQYPTSLEADEAQWMQVPAGSRLHAALRVRIGEKRLLAAALALAKASLAEATAEAKAEAKAAAKAEKVAAHGKNKGRRGDDILSSGKRQKR